MEIANRTTILFAGARHATRTLARAPGFTVTVLLTLALGIGAATAMFSVVNGILLRPLPYPAQERLIELVHEAPSLGLDTLFASSAIYFTYREHNETFDSVGLWDGGNSPVTVTGFADPESVQSLEVTHEVLAILGADPILGRGFTEADDLPGSPPTVMLSHGYWQRHFGGADVLRQSLVIDGVPRQVVGVLPRWFRFFDHPAEVFYPLQPRRTTAMFLSFSGRAIARLADDVTLEEANADVARMIPILREEFPAPREASFANAELRPKLRWLRDSIVGDLGATLWILMGTIGVLLLIACANVANLVLVRAQARRWELAIRAALGASGGSIARIVLLESAALGLAGGSIGLAAAYLCLPILLSMSVVELPQIMTVEVDYTVALFALGTSVVAALTLALVSVLHTNYSKLPRALKSTARSMTEGREGSRARHILLVSQVALALVLLVGSGLMIRTFQALRDVDPGFDDPESVQIFNLTIPEANLSGPEQMVRTQNAILDQLATVPGVESVGFAAFNDGLPLDGDGRSASLPVEGKTPRGGVTPIREIQFVSPGFFETLRTPLVAGRTLQWDDVYGGRRVVLVSENLARAEWGTAAAALGQRVGLGPSGPWFEVIGVMKDIHHDGLSEPAPQSVTFPPLISQAPRGMGTASFVVRSRRVGTPGFVADLRTAVWAVNRSLSPANVQTLGDLYTRSLARTSMALLLVTITGTMALLLGLIGIYGIVGYAVAQRKHEIGIRLALGARRGELRLMFVRHALVLTGLGVAIGLGAAMALTRLMASQLFGISPLDPLTYAAVALILACTGMLASYLPARRASAVDPVTVLQME